MPPPISDTLVSWLSTELLSTVVIVVVVLWLSVDD
jgi:hypothetical protein